MNKKDTRLRRAKRTREKIRELEAVRLCVHRTPKHIYAQIISTDGASVLITASTVDAEIRKQAKVTGNVNAAKLVGSFLAERAKKAGITRVAFDRSGFSYHGRIKALADAARENGLEF